MFNLGLYKESLRKSRTMGTIFILGMLFFSIVIPITHIANHSRMLQTARAHNWLVNRHIMVNGTAILPIFIITAFIGLPVVTFILLSYLNERSSSDFYHAIPHKRTTILFNTILAVITSVIIPAIISSLIIVLIYGISSYSIVNYSSIFWTIASMAAALLLILSGIVLSMSLTGTVLSNITTAAAILFLPRMIIAIFTELVIDFVYIIDHSNFGILARHEINLIFGMGNYRLVNYQHLWQSILYTTVLAIVYMIFAFVAFTKRNSEIATHPGSRLTQNLMRVLITSLLLSPITIALFSQGDMIVFLFTVPLAIIGYFVYEFLSTRKVRSLKSLMFDFLGAAVMNIIFVAALMITQNLFMRPIDTNNVASATLTNVSLHFTEDTVIPDLEAMNFFDDFDITELLVYSLNDTISTGDRWSGRRVRAQFVMENGRVINRTINLRVDSPFATWLRGVEAYQDVVRNLPDTFTYSWDRFGNLSTTRHRLLIESLQEEVNEINFEDWYAVVSHGFFGHELIWSSWRSPSATTSVVFIDETTTSIEIQGRRRSDNTRDFFYSINITEVTPRTYELLSEFLD